MIAVGAVAALAAGAALVGRDRGPDNAVTTLTKVPAAGSALRVDPEAVAGVAPSPVRLTNRAARPVTWDATTDATWLSVSPAAGHLEPGETAVLRVTIATDAPEGDLRGSVQVSGRDGSASVVRVAASIDHPPDVAAATSGCVVTAIVEDESEVAGVALHWLHPPPIPRGQSAEHTDAMGVTTAGYVGNLPAELGPLTWWVSAADARGNRSRTTNETLDPASCTSP